MVGAAASGYLAIVGLITQHVAIQVHSIFLILSFNIYLMLVVCLVEV